MSFINSVPSLNRGKSLSGSFYDSTVYIELEDENEPVRVMRTAFRMPDGQFYELYPDDFHFGTGRYGGGNALVFGGIVPAVADLYIGGHSSDIERGIPPVA